jgi:hypothetical protein
MHDMAYESDDEFESIYSCHSIYTSTDQSLTIRFVVVILNAQKMSVLEITNHSHVKCLLVIENKLLTMNFASPIE